MQYDFYRYVLQIYYGLLLKGHLPRTQESLEHGLDHQRIIRSLDGKRSESFENQKTCSSNFDFIDRRS